MKLKTEDILSKFSNNASHPHEVRRIAMMIFDGLSENVREMSNKDRKILESAALLHDIGYFIDSKSHNKYSQQLILENGLVEFSQHETEMTACIARYHRGSLPDKGKHELYGSFEKKDRKKIKRLAGILRIADGLDRAHLSLIKKIKTTYDEENGIIIFYLTPNTPEFRPDIFSAVRKKDLLEIGFKSQVLFMFSDG